MLNAEKDTEKKGSDDLNVIKKRVTEKDEEIWEVVALDSNIEPRSKPSDLFDQLAEKRKTRHENILKKFSNNLTDINNQTEESIKMSMTDFKAHAKHFEEELAKMMTSLQTSEMDSNDGTMFRNIHDAATGLKSYQQKMVQELHDDLNQFENKRAKENEKLLGKTCEELRKAAHFLPYEVQTFAEQETLKMNQFSLNNRRCYNDLKLTLTLVSEQTFKNFSDQITCFQEKWAREKIEKARKDMQNAAENKMATSAGKLYTRLELKGFELPVETSQGDAYSECKIKNWSENVVEVASRIETYGQNIIEIYKKTLAVVFTNFSEEVGQVVQEINAMENVDIEERIIKPLYFETQHDQTKEMESLENLWQKNLSDMRAIVRDVVDFLQEAGKLWERHRKRFDESKKLILKALEKDEENNEAVLQDLEVRLNMALDSVRQEFNKEKLEKLHESAIAILNSIKERYETIYLNQVAIIEDFYKMADLEADVLSAEIREFVYVLQTAEGTKSCYYSCDQYNSIPDGKFICKEIQKCVQQIKALKSWKHGMWTALEAIPAKAQDHLNSRAETWIQSKIETLAEKVTVQLELLGKRFDRIKLEIYEKRLAEIEVHQDLFDSHQEGVKLAFQRMKEGLEKLTANEFTQLNKLIQNFPDVEKAVKSENRPGVIKTNQITIERTKTQFEENCKAHYEIFRSDCQVTAANIDHANISFMKSIRLFSEGGNYNVDEGKMFVSQLEITDREISTEIKAILKEASKDEAEIFKKSSLVFAPILLLLNNLYEETFFHMEINERMEEFKEKTEDLVKGLRSDLSSLKDQMACLCKLLNSEVEPIRNDCRQYWSLLLETLYKNISNLFYPIKLAETAQATEGSDGREEEDEEVVKLPCFGDGKFSTKATVSRTPTFRSTEVTEQFPCANYKWELFKAEEPPQNDGTFMAVVGNNVWTELDYLHRISCTFYKKIQGRKIERDDIVELTCEMFSKVQVANFRSCTEQCEQVWLQTILDFLPLIGQIKSMANCFFERRFNNYEKELEQTLERQEINFSDHLQSLTRQNGQIFKSLDDKLLPLHGHPKNNHLLAALEEEVVQKTAGLGLQWEGAIKRHKNNLNCFRVNHLLERRETDKIQEEYLWLKEKIFIEDLGTNILDLLMDYANRGGLCTTRTSLERITPRVPHGFRLNLKETNLKTIGEYLNDLRDVADTERSFGTSSPPSPPGKPAILLTPSMDFNGRVQRTFEWTERRLRKMQVFADSMVTVHEEALLSWLNVWKSNVKKVRKLFTVRYEEKATTEENPSPSTIGESMTDEEINKPPTEKTSASVTSTLPRLCPTTQIYSKDTGFDTERVKSLSLRSRPTSDEIKKRPGLIDCKKANLHKSILTEFRNSQQFRFKNVSLTSISPRDYRGLIPIPKRHSLNSVGMSPPATRSPSPVKRTSPKEKSSQKVKTITLDKDVKKKTTGANASRSPSPTKRTPGSYKKPKVRPQSPSIGALKSPEGTTGMKKTEEVKQSISPRTSSPPKRKPKTKVLSSSNMEFLAKEKGRNDPERAAGEAEGIVLKQSSQPSLCKKKGILQPQEKMRLEQLKNEVYAGDHRRLSFEKIQLCIEKNAEKVSLAESKRSYVVTYSGENLKKQKGISLAFVENISSKSITNLGSGGQGMDSMALESKDTIRTPSGEELLLSPSMHFAMENGEIGCEDLDISKLLNESGKNFDDQKEIHVIQDDANEYDSEISTDGEGSGGGKAGKSKCEGSRKTGHSLWKSREADLLNDVDYRQSVYHPAVSRRHEYPPKSKSIEDNYGFGGKGKEKILRTRSSQLKNQYSNQNLIAEKGNDYSDGCPGLVNAVPLYNVMAQEVPLYGSIIGVERIRTKKQRLSGAMLRLTLKIIRLLALFNFWPGDFCHMLSSQSLGLAR